MVTRTSEYPFERLGMNEIIVSDEQQCRVIPSGRAIKAFHRAFPEKDIRMLARLAGSDWQRELAYETATAVAALELCESNYGIRSAYAQIAGISRRVAYRALAAFPLHLPRTATFLSDRDWAASNGLYLGTSMFLLNREYELGLHKALKASAWGMAEHYANLAEQRYMLIRSMAEELDPAEYPIFEAKPAAIWLLCEGAICLRCSETAEASNNLDYQSQKAYIDALNARARENQALASRVMNSPQDGFKNIDLYIDGLAAELASRDPDFDKQRFSPYLAAHRKWNREKQKLRILNQKRAGPKLGQKPKRHTRSTPKEVC